MSARTILLMLMSGFICRAKSGSTSNQKEPLGALGLERESAQTEQHSFGVRTLLDGVAVMTNGPRGLAETVGATETQPLSCTSNQSGGSLCTLSLELTSPDGTETATAAISADCPDPSVTSSSSLRSASGCTCTADISSGSLFGDFQCDCMICGEDFVRDSLILIDCNSQSRTIVGSCLAMDCIYGCNGLCSDSCPAGAEDDPDCTVCHVPSATPSAPPTHTAEPSPALTAEPTPALTAEPTPSPALTAEPTPSPALTAEPTQSPLSETPTETTSEVPTTQPTISTKPSPTLSEAPTTQPTLSTKPSPTLSVAPSTQPSLSTKPSPNVELASPTPSAPPTKSAQPTPGTQKTTQPSTSNQPSPNLSMNPTQEPTSSHEPTNAVRSSSPTSGPSLSLPPSREPTPSPITPKPSEAPTTPPTLSHAPTVSVAPTSSPTRSPKPTLKETEVEMAIFSVAATTVSLNRPVLTENLTAYLTEKLKVAFPKLLRLRLISIDPSSRQLQQQQRSLSDVISHIDYLTVGTFGGDDLPPLDAVIDAQRTVLEDVDPAEEIDMVISSIETEGAAPRGVKVYG